MSQTMTQAECVDQMWCEYASKVLKSGCILDNHLTWEHLSNHQLTCAQSDSTYFPVPMRKIDEWIRQGQGEERVWAEKETRREGGGPRALRGFGRCGPYFFSPSPHSLPPSHPLFLSSPPSPLSRTEETISLGSYTYISRQPRSPQSHTSQVVRKVTHFTC